MKKILKVGSGIVKTLHSKKDAISKFNDLKEPYKVKIIESSEQNEDFQIYTQEESGFIDLCNGPHLPSLKFIGAFKLLNLAGAYWKGDSKMKCLQEFMELLGEQKKNFLTI